MNRRVIGCVVAVAVVLLAATGRTDDAGKTAAFMRLKLAHSQRLLEGLALEDFNLIEKSAQNLSLLTQDETWQIFQTPEYLQYSTEFRKAADGIAAAARKRNLDGAAWSYVGLTMQCVNCHKHVRDEQRADRGATAPQRLGSR